MTYTNYQTTTKTTPAGGFDPSWKNPVNGREYKNDPERDNHLFDSHKAFHSKDDASQLIYVLKQLKDLGGEIMDLIQITKQIQTVRCAAHYIQGVRIKRIRKPFHHGTMTAIFLPSQSTL